MESGFRHGPLDFVVGAHQQQMAVWFRRFSYTELNVAAQKIRTIHKLKRRVPVIRYVKIDELADGAVTQK